MAKVSPAAAAPSTIHRLHRLLSRSPKPATVRIFVFFLFWCIAAHASVVCIVHCQVMPWVEQRFEQPLPLFVCDFGGRASSQDVPTPSKMPLPEIIQLVLLATLLAPVCSLRVTGSIVPVWTVPFRQSAPPLTPPPRSAASPVGFPC